MTATTPAQRAALKKSGSILARTLKETADAVRPGITTAALDAIASAAIQRQGATAAFLGYKGFPATLCTSVNMVVVHGIPSKTEVLADGDIIGLDLGVNYQGAFTDMAVTVPIGTVHAKHHKLMQTARQSLFAGLAVVRAGAHTGDIGAAVQEVAERSGYSVVRDFVGHGVGAAVHEDPQVPNFGPAGSGVVLHEGDVLAIEPMVNAGRADVRIAQDGWKVLTQDGSHSAHFEVTILVTKDGFTYLTPPFI